MANTRGESGNSDRLYFPGLQNLCGLWLQPWNKKTLAFWKESYDKPRSILKNKVYHFANKVLYSQSYVFSISHVRMWELNHKEDWVSNNWCFWTVMLEKTLKVPWTASRSSQSILKEINPEYSLEGLILKLKLQYFGHLMQRADSLEKNTDAGKD